MVVSTEDSAQAQLEELNGFANGAVKGADEGEHYVFTVQEYYAEQALEAVCTHMNDEDIYLFRSDVQGAELAVRAAYRKKGSSVAGAGEIHRQGDAVCVKKMVYANHMEGTFALHRPPYGISIAKGSKCKPLTQEQQKNVHSIRQTSTTPDYISERRHTYNAPSKGLQNAKIVVIAGRGVDGRERVADVARLAELLGAELGVTRPVAMNAWAPMHKLVGVSGEMVAPELCLVFAGSGAPAFYAGIEKSGTIIAVNNKESSPIMKKSDAVITSDYQEILSELLHLLEEKHKQDISEKTRDENL